MHRQSELASNVWSQAIPPGMTGKLGRVLVLDSFL